MITLPQSLQVQIGEAVSTIADSDFPDKWENLVPELVSRLGSDIKTNNGVLAVAHSIFKRWRPLFRSDALFKEIALVLSQFSVPFLAALKETDSLIEQSSNDKNKLKDLFQCLHLLVKIYFDLNCQDIPEFFEDNLDTCMSIFHKYLVYKNPVLETADDDEPSVVEFVKSSICEVLELYTQRYLDVFERLLSNFVQTTWNMLTTTGIEPKFDLLVSKALGFLTSVAKVQQQANNIFASDEVLEQVVKNIVLPNLSLRATDEELFEDDPIEFTRRDLDGSDSDTRRRAATDLIRELAAHLEAKVTEVAMKYVNGYLATYNSNRVENWRAKDAATYLFSAIAAKSNMTSAGVSSTNLLLDIVGFFAENVAPDLVAESNVHPILKVDAIKYIYTFRNQLTKDQLISAFPLLSSLLSSTDYVVYTYASVTIERILSIRDTTGSNNSLMFQKADIAPVSQDLLTNLFRLIRQGSTSPEKLAENEFLMKCIMRILITSQESTAPYAEHLIHELVDITVTICKNPSNPKFSHYTFEAIGSIIRFDGAIVGADKLENIILNPFLQILGGDVTEFIPYVFQVLSQLLNTPRPSKGLPEVYQPLVRPLMSPALWESRGNVPALVGLLEAILTRGSELIIETGSLEPLLGVFQKLIASKALDAFGFDLLEKIFLYLPLTALAPYNNQIALILLRRLETGRTDKYVSRLSNFIYFLAAVENNPGLGPIFAVEFIDSAQAELFGQILERFILPSTLQINGYFPRKIAAIGLTKIIMQNPKFIEGSYSSKYLVSLQTLIKLLKSAVAEPLNDSTALDLELDLDEISFGASFAKLATTSVHPYDPAPSIKNPSEFFISELRRVATQYPGPVYQLIGQLPDDSKKYLNQLGFT
ncbi:Cse1p [Sugiyamaella lignohabitans]|uniref:Cse1p n=1 Tax=Sugiyamaella lignohabitans TaxID=796027 RepID=A0A167FAV5_9ASCO|nr:Cse1p [Sugiyamaella lignohabitans]ANB15048.1 Cse1p [Sugiyamaella lignohabitans]